MHTSDATCGEVRYHTGSASSSRWTYILPVVTFTAGHTDFPPQHHIFGLGRDGGFDIVGV